MNSHSNLNSDMALLTESVREAGKIALSFFGKDPQAEKKSDGSPVSEADYAVDKAMREKLMSARPGYGWLSEETEDDRVRLEHDRVWIVDPIDGTRAFLKGKPEWTVAAALVEAGRPVLAIVFNPATDEFFEARKNSKTLLNGTPVLVTEAIEVENSRLVASSGLLRRDIWEKPWPSVQTKWVNSVAYRLALVAAGKYDGTLSLTPKHDWDLAAAELLVQEAGGCVSTHTGGALLYNSRSPLQESVIAAGPTLHRELLERSRTVRI